MTSEEEGRAVKSMRAFERSSEGVQRCPSSVVLRRIEGEGRSVARIDATAFGSGEPKWTCGNFHMRKVDREREK